MKKAVFPILFVLLASIVSIGALRLNYKPCVVILGDSIFALSDEEQMFLQTLSGDKYRAYCRSGA